LNYDAADNPRLVSSLDWPLAFVSVVPCTLSITINNDILIAGTSQGQEEIRSCRAVPPGLCGGCITSQRKVKNGAQLAERGPWKAGIAERVKYIRNFLENWSKKRSSKLNLSSNYVNLVFGTCLVTVFWGGGGGGGKWEVANWQGTAFMLLTSQINYILFPT
jgi:hypothetical protein